MMFILLLLFLGFSIGVAVEKIMISRVIKNNYLKTIQEQEEHIDLLIKHNEEMQRETNAKTCDLILKKSKP